MRAAVMASVLSALATTHADASIGAPTTTSSAFTVTWTDVAARYQLRESTDAGAHWTVIFEGTAQQFAITARAPGTYQYNVALCVDVFGRGGCNFYLPVSVDPASPATLQIATVQVTAPPPDPVASTSTTQDVPTSPALDSGPRDAGGQCLGVVRMFSGTSGRCRKAGAQTAWQNCCDNKLPRLSDTLGATGGRSQRQYRDEASAIAVFDNQCDIRDQQTALLADSGYCIEVGTFCAESVPLVGCVQESKAYCCYGSQLARIIQEQGRAQLPSLGGFGTPTAPDCRGFTVDQFRAIDFSKLDLTSYYTSLKTRAQSVLQQGARDAAQHRVDGG